jgi:hypothetical protein
MRVRAWIGCVSITGRALGGRVAGERGRESRSPIFKFKSSLKTSAVAPPVARATAFSGAANKGDVMAVVTKWLKTVDTKILEAVNDRVLRNYERILELNGGNFYDESRV